jgi:hypothetical protein
MRSKLGFYPVLPNSLYNILMPFPNHMVRTMDTSDKVGIDRRASYASTHLNHI